MSFDVFLFRFRDGQPVAADPTGARRALETAPGVVIQDPGCYSVKTLDGGRVEMYTDRLDGSEPFVSCSFVLRGWTPQILALMFLVAQSTDMVMVPTICEVLCILSLEGQRAHLPPELLLEFIPVLCHSPEELGGLLSGGFEEWKAYRASLRE